MINYLKNRPMLLCGVLSLICTAVSLSANIWLIIVCCLVSIILVLLILFKSRAELILVFLLLIPLMLNTINLRSDINRAEAVNERTAVCRLCIYAITYESNDFCVAEAQVMGGGLEKGSKLSLLYKDERLYVGQTIDAKVNLKTVDDEYRNIYYSKEIFLRGSMENITQVQGKDDFVLKTVQKVRQYIKNTLFENLGYNEAATLCALIFGDNSYFTESFYNNVKGAGVSHVMVVSGMHLSILVVLFTAISEKIFYNRFFKGFCMVLTALLLTALCGFTMSILRAGVTYILMALALVIKRPNNCENTLGAAVSLILTVSPNAVLSAAFQLSVASTFGILCVALPIMRYITENELIKSVLVDNIVNAVLVTLSAMLLTLPIAIKLFGYISNVAVITNLLISYAVTLVLWLSVTALVINLFLPYVASAVFIVCSALTKYINAVINYFGSRVFAVTRVNESYWIFAVSVIILIFWILLACKNRRYMIKLKEMDEKIIKEGGTDAKWQRFLKRL